MKKINVLLGVGAAFAAFAFTKSVQESISTAAPEMKTVVVEVSIAVIAGTIVWFMAGTVSNIIRTKR